MIDQRTIPRAVNDGQTVWADRLPDGGPVVMRLEGEHGSPSVEVLMAPRPDWFVCPDTPEVRALGLVPGKRRVLTRIVSECPAGGHKAWLDVAEGEDRLGCYECPTCKRFYVVQLDGDAEPLWRRREGA